MDPCTSLQSHPFTIASWRDGQPTSFEAVIEPRSGFTRRLLDCADDYQEDDISRVKLRDEPERRAFVFTRNYPSQMDLLSLLRSQVNSGTDFKTGRTLVTGL